MDNLLNDQPVNMDLNVLLGKPPKTLKKITTEITNIIEKNIDLKKFDEN